MKRPCTFLSLENWKRRAEIVNYCVNIVDQSVEEKRKSLSTEGSDARAQTKTQAAMFANEVKVRRRHRLTTPFLTEFFSCRETKFIMN